MKLELPKLVWLEEKSKYKKKFKEKKSKKR